jgi:hypothetical protein
MALFWFLAVVFHHRISIKTCHKCSNIVSLTSQRRSHTEGMRSSCAEPHLKQRERQVRSNQDREYSPPICSGGGNRVVLFCRNEYSAPRWCAPGENPRPTVAKALKKSKVNSSKAGALENNSCSVKHKSPSGCQSQARCGVCSDRI